MIFLLNLIYFQNSITIANDPGTSDDSGRASERLTTSSVAPRDADSSRDRLSDVSFIFVQFEKLQKCKTGERVSVPTYFLRQSKK